MNSLSACASRLRMCSPICAPRSRSGIGAAAAGYEAMGEFGLPGRRYFRKGGANRTHQLHAYQYDAVHAITRHVAYRDYMRAHAEARAAYGELKAALASRFPDDIGAYCDGKDEFVKEYERRALIWHWQKLAAARPA